MIAAWPSPPRTPPRRHPRLPRRPAARRRRARPRSSPGPRRWPRSTGGRPAYDVEVVAETTEPIVTRDGAYGIAPARTTALGPRPDRHADRRRRLGRLRAGLEPLADPLGPQRRPALAPGHLGLLGLVPARRGRPARGQARHHPLVLLRRARAAPPRDRGGPRADLRPRRRRLDLGRRHRGHGPLARPGRGRPRPRGRRRGRPLARPLPPAPRRPGPVQHPASGPGRAARPAPRAPALDGRPPRRRPAGRGAGRARRR